MSTARQPLRSPELAPMEPMPDSAGAWSRLALLQSSLGNAFLSELLGLGGRGGEAEDEGRIGLGEGIGALARSNHPLRSGTDTRLASAFVDQSQDDLYAGIDQLTGVAGRHAGTFIEAAAGSLPVVGPAAREVLDARTMTEGTAGFLKAGVDAGADLARLSLDPLGAVNGMAEMGARVPTVGNPLRLGLEGWEALRGEQSWKEAARAGLDPRANAVEDGLFWASVGKEVIKPFQESWEAGRPAEAAGRLLFEVAPDLLGAGLGFHGVRNTGRMNKAAAASKAATGGNGLTREMLDRLLAESVERANQQPGWTPRAVEDVIAKARLQDPKDFFKDLVGRYEAGGQSRTEAIDAAAGTNGYEFDSQLFFRSDLDPRLHREIVQHEVNHLYGLRAGRSESEELLIEGLNQHFTQRMLDAPVESYPNLLALVRRLEPVVGAEGLNRAWLSDGLKGLREMLPIKDHELARSKLHMLIRLAGEKDEEVLKASHGASILASNVVEDR